MVLYESIQSEDDSCFKFHELVSARYYEQLNPGHHSSKTNAFIVYKPYISRGLLIWPTRALCAPAWNAKTADNSCTSDFKWTDKSPKLKDGQHLRWNSQVTIDAAMNNFNSGQFKIRMKQMAAQVNFYLCPHVLLSSELFGAWKLAHICQIKALLTYIKRALEYEEPNRWVSQHIELNTTADALLKIMHFSQYVA